MRYLKIFGLSDDDIDAIIKANDQKTINELIVKEDQVSKVIDYLVDLGIRDIYPYLTYRVDFLNEDLGDITETFHKFGENEAVKLLNESIDNLDLIYYNN